MRRKVFALILATISVGSLSVQAVTAEEYPTKPIEIVCPYTPGSITDTVTRLIADIAPKYLRQPMIVVNKPGASDSIGASDVISSKADGYKLVILSNVFFSLITKTQKIPFDPTDLSPIANFVEMKLGLNVRSESPWKNLNDLLDYARKNPGKLSWAHTGRGKSTHINGLLIFRKAGVETIDVPYKGTPEMLAALLGGHIDASGMGYGGVKELVRAGKIRYLLFFNDRRYEDPSDVPSAAELGFPEAGKLPTLFGLYAHKNTPENIRKILIDTSKKVYENPEFKKGIERLGEEPRFLEPKLIMESIKDSEKISIPVLRDLGLYVGK